MLEIKNISKRFGKKADWVLHDVSLAIEEGELIALLGESGCGKTTLLRIIAGLEEVDNGEVIIAGNTVVSNNVFIQPENRKVGMVFQDFALFPHLTVSENIAFGIHRLNKKMRDERVKELLHQIALQKFGHRYPYELSGGQQQRVALARALATRPKLLLLDEPFSSLDTVLKDEMRVELKRIIKQSGTTAVFVTHDTQDALSTADKVAILKNGKLRQYGSPFELYEKPSNAYIANFMGNANCIEAISIGGAYKTAFGLHNFKNDDQFSGNITLVVRPEDIELVDDNDNSMSGIIINTSYYGDHQKVLIENNDAQLFIKCSKREKLEIGSKLSFRINEISQLKPDPVH